MHIPWKNCPLALHGQYVGKDKKPRVVLEAACDYNLWIWHMQFGFAGSLNDLNIWANSKLTCNVLEGLEGKRMQQSTLDAEHDAT